MEKELLRYEQENEKKNRKRSELLNIQGEESREIRFFFPISFLFFFLGEPRRMRYSFPMNE